MQLTFEAIEEVFPGPKWQSLYAKHWPAYKRWFLARRRDAGPSLSTAIKKLRCHMPELMPTFERLVELAGGDDLSARFLSCYRPPAYLIGCSQAVWIGPQGPLLVRNYDLDPGLNEGLICHSAWNGRRVIATSEFLWGVADGLNDAGLALSLAFGGRKVVGEGFGIPLILRYILEFCATAADAVEVLKRVPSHMAYNVTVLDRRGDFATVAVAPDRPSEVVRQPVATNHQGAVEWREHARFTGTLERERFLRTLLADAKTTEQSLIEAFLQPPLYSTDYRNGFGTLYTAVYRPARNEAEWRWPNAAWMQSLQRFQEGQRELHYSRAGAQLGSAEEGVQQDNAWTFNHFGLAGILGQVFSNVCNTLNAAGSPPPPKLDEFLAELERSGQIPWEKLATAWSDGADENPARSSRL